MRQMYCSNTSRDDADSPPMVATCSMMGVIAYLGFTEQATAVGLDRSSCSHEAPQSTS